MINLVRKVYTFWTRDKMTKNTKNTIGYVNIFEGESDMSSGEPLVRNGILKN